MANNETDKGELEQKKVEEASEIHHQSKTPKKWNTILAPEPEPLSQVFIDLMDMSKIATKKGNKNYNFGLVMIDVYSRRGWIEPIKNKTTSEVLEGLKKMPKPKRITSDNGSEFKGQVADYFKENGIIHTTNEVGDHRTMGIVDRFIRTIRNDLNLMWEVNDDFIWVPYIYEIVDNYNNTYHNTIKATPMEVYDGKKKNDQEIYRAGLINSFPKGSTVRKELERTVFSKGDVQYSKKVYTVKGRKGFKLILGESELVSPQQLLKSKMKEQPEEVKPQLADNIKVLTKEKKNSNLLKSLDIKPENIRSSARIKKKKEILDL